MSTALAVPPVPVPVTVPVAATAAREYAPMEPAEMPGLPADAAVLPLSALVIGCETELGRLVVGELARMPVFAEVYAVTEVVVGLRGELGLAGVEAAKVAEILVDYDRMEEGLRGVLMRAARVVAFCCLGMTKEESSCPREYYRHNYDLPLRFVSAVLEGHILRVSVLSCKDADTESRLASEAQQVRGGMEEAIDRLWNDEYYVQMFTAKRLDPGYAFFQAPMLLVDGLRAAGDYRRHVGGGAPVSRRALAKQRAALRFGLGPTRALPVRDVAAAMVHEARDYVLLVETADDPALQANVRQLQRYAVEPEEIAALAEKGREEETKNLALSHRQRMQRRVSAREAVKYRWGDAANFDRDLIRRDGEFDYTRPLVLPPPPPPPALLPSSPHPAQGQPSPAGRHVLLPLGGGPEGPAAYRVLEDGGGGSDGGSRRPPPHRLGVGASSGRDYRAGGRGSARAGLQMMPGMRSAAAEAPYLGWHGEHGAGALYPLRGPDPAAGVGADTGMGMEMLPGYAGLSARGSRRAMLHTGWMEQGGQERGRADPRGQLPPLRGEFRGERVHPHHELWPVRADQGPQQYYEEELDGFGSDHGYEAQGAGYDAGYVYDAGHDGAQDAGLRRPPLTSGEALEQAVELQRKDKRRAAGGRRRRPPARNMDERQRYERSADRERRRPLHRRASMYSVSEETSASDTEARHEVQRHRRSARRVSADSPDVQEGRFRGGMRQLRDEHDDPFRGVKHSLWGLAEKFLGPGPRIRDVRDPVVAI